MRDEIFIAIFVLSGVILGWILNEIYDYQTNKITIRGLWIPTENLTKTDVLNYANSRSIGNWICVNIEDETLDGIENTIRHEIGHEMFAQKCAKNWTNCQEVMK